MTLRTAYERNATDKNTSSVAWISVGFCLGIALNISIFGGENLLAERLTSTPVLDRLGYFSFALFGMVQSIWQVPLILSLSFKGHKNLALGVIIAFIFTILLNIVWFLFIVKW